MDTDDCLCKKGMGVKILKAESIHVSKFASKVALHLTQQLSLFRANMYKLNICLGGRRDILR